MSFEQLENSLKTKGLRLTLARKVVYSALAQSSKALSAKEVFQTIGADNKEKADLASIYRNLDLFNELGIIHEVFSGKYSLCAQSVEDGHDHVHIVSVCSLCGASSELSGHDKATCQLSNALKTQSKSLKKVTSITLQGICSGCLS